MNTIILDAPETPRESLSLGIASKFKQSLFLLQAKNPAIGYNPLRPLHVPDSNGPYPG